MGIAAIDNGRPTKPDVDLLMERFGGLRRDGSLVPHSEIEAVIGESRTSRRYWTVFYAFRDKLLAERGVYLDGRSARGQGFYALEGVGHTGWAVRYFGFARKMVKRAGQVLGVVPDEELPPEERMRREHVALYLTTAARSMDGAQKAIAAPPKQPEPLPRHVAR